MVTSIPLQFGSGSANSGVNLPYLDKPPAGGFAVPPDRLLAPPAAYSAPGISTANIHNMRTDMTASSYDEALKRVLVHEGGYSNHPSDPGGPTNWGITIHDARAYW